MKEIGVEIAANWIGELVSSVLVDHFYRSVFTVEQQLTHS